MRRLRGEEGSASIEFVLIFPAFMVLLVSAVEMGMQSLRQVMLERALDLTVRSLRIGAIEDPTFANVRAHICQNAVIVPACSEALHLELSAISKDSWSVPQLAPACIDRSSEIQPVLVFTPGQRNEYMLMRACVVFDPLFPTFGLAPHLPLDASGGYRLLASSAFVNEP